MQQTVLMSNKGRDGLSSRGRAATHHTLGSSTASIMVTPVTLPLLTPMSCICSLFFLLFVEHLTCVCPLVPGERATVESRHSERCSPYEAIYLNSSFMWHRLLAWWKLAMHLGLVTLVGYLENTASPEMLPCCTSSRVEHAPFWQFPHSTETVHIDV
jgi:hypothetical protein